LLKPSKDSASLLVYNEKILVLSFSFFVGNVISGIGFWPFWLRLLGPGPQAHKGNISLQFLLETRLESESSFEPWIGFLAFLFLFKNYGLKNNKLINYLIRGLINLLFFGP